MPWLELKLPCEARQVTGVEDRLLEAGALSVTLVDSEDQPLFEPAPGETPLWDKVTVVGLFPGDADRVQLEKRLGDLATSLGLAETLFTTLDDQAWERAWLDRFEPMCFGDRLWICPQGMAPAATAGVIMELDPGLAFGTGTHPTTALCLEWLACNNLDNRTLIDYGCGSGILGIAALLLGARQVHGVDNDPQALTASAKNGRKNQVDSDRFPLYLPGDFARVLAAGEIRQVDVVLANILAAPLVSLADYLTAMVRPGGTILLSGILADQADMIMDTYGEAFDLAPPARREDWVRISGRRKAT